MPKTIEEQLKETEAELDRFREKERSSFYAEVREALAEIRSSINETNKSVAAVQGWITVMGETKEIKATLDDYKIFKAQVKTGLVVMNVVWSIAVVLLNWFFKH